ncbi:MAG: hypothetical protein JXO22_02750 [Phycisphaerae bacterium]|nr:hypothetical protein [Phycisphaerae bacterium]
MPSSRRIVMILAILITPLMCVSCDRTKYAATCEVDTAPTTQASEAERARVRNLVQDIGADHPAPTATIPPGHPPMPSAEPPAAVKPLVFAAPAEWQRQRVSNPMRIDQYLLPRAEGDDEDGEMAVFFFAGASGSIDDNVRRWSGQFTTADGQPIGDDAVHRETLEVGGRNVALVDIAGQYHPMAMLTGHPSPAPKSGQHMLAAIVDTPAGRMVFKAVGPDATIEHHRAAVMRMLESLTDQ